MLLDSFDHARQVSKQLRWWKWKWKNLDFASLEIHKTIMAPKWLTYACQQTHCGKHQNGSRQITD